MENALEHKNHLEEMVDVALALEHVVVIVMVAVTILATALVIPIVMEDVLVRVAEGVLHVVEDVQLDVIQRAKVHQKSYVVVVLQHVRMIVLHVQELVLDHVTMLAHRQKYPALSIM